MRVMKSVVCMLLCWLMITTTMPIFASANENDMFVEDAVNVTINGEDYRVPKILIDSEDANKVNEEILCKYEPIINALQANYGAVSLNYTHSCSNGVLSVAIFHRESLGREYDIYNFDIETGKSLDVIAMCNKFGKDYSKIKEDVIVGINDYYQDMINSYGVKEQDTIDRLEYSLSDENLAETEIYLEDERLTVLYRVKGIAGATYYYRTIDITEDHYEEELWKGAFVQYLQSLTNIDIYEFALVDIDGDSVPELYEHCLQRPGSSRLSWYYEGQIYTETAMFIDGFEYIEGQNLFRTFGVQSGVEGEDICEIVGTEMRTLHSGTIRHNAPKAWFWDKSEVSKVTYNTLSDSAFNSSFAKRVENYYALDDILDEVWVYSVDEPRSEIIEDVWKKKYRDFIVDDHERNKNEIDWDNVSYELIYIDDDNIPELWIDRGVTAYGCDFVTFQDGYVYSYSMNLGYLSYVEKNNIFMHSEGRQGFYSDSIYKISGNNSLTAIGQGAYVSIVDADSNPGFYYAWSGEEMTHQEYELRKNTFINPELKRITGSESGAIYNYDELLDELKNDNDNNEYAIAILTTEKSLCVEKGKEIRLGFGILNLKTGLLEGDWKKMAVSVSNSSIVLLSDYEKNEFGYDIVIKGFNEGTTNLTVTDTDTGLNTIIQVTVKEKYNKSYSRPIEDVGVFYPNNKYENSLATNFYDINGLYVNGYECKKQNDIYSVSFDVYNSKYHIGAVDVYDKNNNWIRCYEIQKQKYMESVFETGEQTYYLVVNGLKWVVPGGEKGNLMTYEQQSNSKHTHLDIEVPDGGYFTISNNVKESPGTYLYNVSELLLEACLSVVEGSISGVEAGPYVKLLLEDFDADPALREAFYEIYMKTVIKELENYASNMSSWGISNACCNLVYDYQELLKTLDISWVHLAETVCNFGEEAITKFGGPAGVALEACFNFSKGSNKILQITHLIKSLDEPYVSIYARYDSDIVYSNGVVVNTEGNTDSEAVLQVFRISDSDVIEIVLDDEDPLQMHELYNICFVKDDKEVQPNGKVTVYLPIPEEMKSDRCIVYRQESDGSWSVIEAHVEGNYLVFQTDHFSYYAIVGDKCEIAIASMPKKTLYSVGDDLKVEGLTLDIDGKIVSNGYICTPTKFFEKGPQTITVTYGTHTTEFSVDVNGGLLGDSNLDGKVNIKDATLIQKHIAALVTMNEEQLSVSDVNLDGKVNVKDATYIQKFIAGLVSMPEVDVETETTIPTTTIIEPESIIFDNTSLTLNVGESKSLSANVLPDNAVDKSVVWETSDSSIITVSDGTVFAVSVGTANITAKTNNGKTATCEVIVKDVEASNVILSANELSLKLGEEYSLLATIEPENVADKSILWSTSDDTIVSVNNGVIKAEKIGVAVITAETANGIKASCNVTVTPIEAEYITLNTNSLTLKVGEESILTPTIHPENVTDKELTLISSDTSVVTVAGRIISAVGVGNATITVSTSNGKYAVCEVTVEEVDASNIILSSNNIEMDIGDTYNLIATIEPADVTDRSIVWTTSDSDVATVDKGLVSAKDSGTATITAQTTNGLKAVCEITVYMPVSGVYELFLNLRKNPDGCYRLTADDTLNSLDVNLDTFTGCINGDGHTITINYDVTSKDVTEDCYKALLPKSDGAIIKNLNMSGTIDHEMYSDGSYSNYCAGFVAYAENTTFIDCTNEATIKAVVWSDYSGYGYVGGITAWSENCEFINCKNKGDLQITAMPTRIASSVAGGISGQSSNSKFDTCSNAGNIGTHSSNTSDTYYSIAYSGGIVGSSDCSDLTNCVTSGNLMANAWPNYETHYTSVAASGGIVAYGNGNLENCSSSCKLNPSATNGGAVYKGELIAYKN